MGPNALEATEVVHLREHARVDTSAGELVDALPDAIVEDALPDALAADAIPDALVADCTPDAADGWEEFLFLLTSTMRIVILTCFSPDSLTCTGISTAIHR